MTNNYCFYSGCDIYGYDNTIINSINLDSKKKINEIICNLNFEGINTLGYCKKNIKDKELEPCSWNSEIYSNELIGKDGIYIKKDKWEYNKKEDNRDRLILITPSVRPLNLLKIIKTLNFDLIKKWIIIYDIDNLSNELKEWCLKDELLIKENQTIEENKYLKIIPKIIELKHSSYGCSGNPQRNYALEWLNKNLSLEDENSFIYYLDDDNIIHNEFWNTIKYLENGYIYTFDQEQKEKVLYGNIIKWREIDTGQVLLYYPLIKNERWMPSIYMADYVYIHHIITKNYNKHRYINKVLSYYNNLM